MHRHFNIDTESLAFNKTRVYYKGNQLYFLNMLYCKNTLIFKTKNKDNTVFKNLKRIYNKYITIKFF